MPATTLSAKRTLATDGLPVVLQGPCRRTVAVFLFAAMSLTFTRAQTEPVSELQLKAAFLYNFAKFVQWPANSLPEPTTQFQICVVGSDVLRDELRFIARQKTVGEHKLLVRDVPSADAARGCHILFLSSASRKQTARVPEDLRGILTVSDAEGFVKRGGMISLVMSVTAIFSQPAESATVFEAQG